VPKVPEGDPGTFGTFGTPSISVFGKNHMPSTVLHNTKGNRSSTYLCVH
jgi:hypothetical protein